MSADGRLPSITMRLKRPSSGAIFFVKIVSLGLKSLGIFTQVAPDKTDWLQSRLRSLSARAEQKIGDGPNTSTELKHCLGRVLSDDGGEIGKGSPCGNMFRARSRSKAPMDAMADRPIAKARYHPHFAPN